MIKTVNELLIAIKDKGIKQIEPFLNIKHGPTIGDMYEGLTKEIATKAVFENTDIRVVSGFITNADGEMTNQIDCMIVVGDGEQIPKTENYIYDINSVIMVIEVKKNLYSKELSEGYENLRSVYKVTKPDHEIRVNLVDDAFEGMVGKPAPNYDEIGKLSIREQMLFHSLVVEALLPLRVIFGFEGFKTEMTLRQKFREYLIGKSLICGSETTLEEALHKLDSEEYTANKRPDNKYGYGSVSLPNLIVVGENSIVKTNGMPYGVVFDKTDEFCWMASYRRNPLLIFLELLWTRLTYYYDLPSEVFGSDVYREGIAPLLTATGTKNGWVYNFIDYDQKAIEILDKNDKPWEPTRLQQNEFILINLLCEGKEISVGELNRYVDGNADEILKHLNYNRLAYVDESGVIKLLTKNCGCVIVPGYGYVAGDNSDGRLMYWVSERMWEKKCPPK